MPARILVVDDSPTIRRVVTMILGRRGHETIPASGGVQAWELLSASPPPAIDLVLADLVMPAMGGAELCAKLRASDVPQPPVVLMTAKANHQRGDLLRETGAVDAIDKPFDARALLQVVENALRSVRGGESLGGMPSVPPPSTLPAPSNALRGSRIALARAMVQLVAPALGDRPGAAEVAALTAKVERGLSRDALAELRERIEAAFANPHEREVLRGDAAVVPLGEVLQVLHLQRQTGTLRVTRGQARVDVLFHDGLVDMAWSHGAADEFRIGRYFVDEGIVTSGQVEEVARSSSSTGLLLGESLVRAGHASQDDLRKAIARQTSELMYEILRWPEATYVMVVGHASRPSMALSLPVASLVMEGFRRVDEWRLMEEQFDMDSVLVADRAAIDALPPGSLSRVERAVLDAIDGTKTVRAIVEASYASSFDACRALHQFMKTRIVKRAPS